MISQAIELIKPQKLETGLTKAVKDMKEIQLDAPHAPRFIRVIVEELGNLNTLLEKQFLLYRIQMVSWVILIDYIENCSFYCCLYWFFVSFAQFMPEIALGNRI